MKAFSVALMLSIFVSPFAHAGPSNCVAIRGNGELVTAHFASLAKILESEPLFEGGVGGSSGSISLFLYESMTQNPGVKDCKTCSDAEKAHRVSLLLKSLFTYIDVVKDDNEFTALIRAASTIEKALKAVGITKNTDVSKLKAIDVAKLGPELATILLGGEIPGLLNKEFLKMLVFNPFEPSKSVARIREAIVGLQTFGDFDASDKRVLFRPGVLDFEVIAKRFGRIGDFYAGRGRLPVAGGKIQNIYDQASMDKFFGLCTDKALGRSWTELKNEDPTCSNMILDIMTKYRKRLIPVEDKITDPRITEPVGKYAHILISTAYLPDGVGQIFKNQRKLYLAGDPGFAAKTPLGIFDKFEYGYWGQPGDTAGIEAVAKDPRADFKTSRARGLKSVDWLTAISRSAAEPGLSRIQEGPGPNDATGAGWDDLSPVPITRSMGCTHVVYVTRMGTDSPFGIQVAREFGMSGSQEYQIYDLGEEHMSSFRHAITEADEVFCTNWNAYSGFTEIPKLEKDAYETTPAPASQQKWLGCGGREMRPKDVFPNDD